MQHDDAVGERAHDVHLVLDEQDGLGRVGLQPRDQVEHDRNLVDAHAGGRLVEHVDLRLERHHHRDLELALVAVRQRGGLRVALARRGPTDRSTASARSIRSRARRARGGAYRNARRPRACTASRTFSATLRRGKRLVSWNARPSPSRVRCGAPRRVTSCAVDQHRAVGGAELAGHQIEVGRLARAVRPDDGGQLAGPERAGHVIDRDMTAEADGQAAGFQRRASSLVADRDVHVLDLDLARRAPESPRRRWDRP